MNASHGDSCMRRISGVSSRAIAIGLAALSLIGCDTLSRPTEADVRGCLVAAGGVSVRLPPQNAFAAAIGIVERGRIRNPTISNLEWGQVITSQGSMIEMSVGAPGDTKIFPARIHISESTDAPAYWIFLDSFGKLKCVLAPGT
jgi:hypothetical protein